MEPYLGEIRIMSFAYPPKGWALCNGQLMPINQNQALFSLLGTTYGGDGRVNFALPDFRGRVAMHSAGANFTLGQSGGQASHTVTIAELPTHTHALDASSSAATTGHPAVTVGLAASQGASLYAAPASLTTMAPNAVSSVGGSQPHENRQPFLVLSFCIAIQGIFPSRN